MMSTKMKAMFLVAGCVMAMPALAQVVYRDAGDSHDDYALVVRVDPVVDHYREPVTREKCWETPPEVQARTTGYSDDYVRTSERRCHTETEWRGSDRVSGYDVVYQYDGRDYRAHLDHYPPEHLRIRVNYDDSISPYDDR